MPTYTKPALPVGLDRALRELAARSHYHPDDVVETARIAGMRRLAGTSGEGKSQDATMADLAREKILTIADQACACSVQVRPTNEYHACMCWAGTVVKRFNRYLDNVERKANANITIG